MWLLKLHFSISVLCLITFIGFAKVCKEQIIENGWIQRDKKEKKKISVYLIFFVPILNVLADLIIFAMILCKKSDIDEKVKEMENEHDGGV